jgi:isopentenyl-diphosphate delta-isomerase
MQELINLVSEHGERLGSVEKIAAHEQGLLHEAFSIFVFNENQELLIHRRALEKYHSAGLWTNTCCSHARFEEKIEEATHRRLQEEMGFDCALTQLFSFTYNAHDLDSDLTEHELDYVFIGQIDDKTAITPNPAEVCDFQWIALPDLKKDATAHPEKYTTWLKIILGDKSDELKAASDNLNK